MKVETKDKMEQHVQKELIQSIDFEKRVITVRAVEKPRLITGTKISTIMGRDGYSTPFAEACSLFRIYWEVESNKFTRFGQANEPKIRSWVRKSIKERDYGFGARLDVENPCPADVCMWDHFNYSKRPFGGLVDGYVTADGKNAAVLEIKTASKRDGWEDSEGRITKVPENYVEQASLYANLSGLRKIVFAVGFASDEDYENPEAWTPNESNTFIVVVDAKDMTHDMDESRAWLQNIQRTRQLPPWTDNPEDQRVINRICTKVLPILSVRDEKIVDQYILTGDAKLLEDIKRAMVSFANFETTVAYTQDGHRFVCRKKDDGWSIETEAV